MRICWPVSLIAIVLTLSPLVSAQRYTGDFAVIANPMNPVENVTSAQLHRLVMGQDRFWARRIPVSLVSRDERSPERAFLLGKFLSMSGNDYRQHWSSMVFRGEAASEPVEVPSSGLASGLVASRPGGLCILRADNVPKDGSVKVVKVDGKLPGEDGYPLHF
jgi:hypothetical protein